MNDKTSGERVPGSIVAYAARLVRAAQLHRRDAWAGEGELRHAIHGTIVAAAVMAAASLHGSLGQIVITMVVTLLVYWVAERYSALLATGVHGRESIRTRIFVVLRGGWPMIEAAYLPMIVMVAVAVLGGNLQTGVFAGLSASVLLLVALGLIAAHRAGASGFSLVGWGLVSGLFGLAMVALKLLLH